jgi:hypothetical protein
MKKKVVRQFGHRFLTAIEQHMAIVCSSLIWLMAQGSWLEVYIFSKAFSSLSPPEATHDSEQPHQAFPSLSQNFRTLIIPAACFHNKYACAIRCPFNRRSYTCSGIGVFVSHLLDEGHLVDGYVPGSN